jgi:hypothetical protein
MGFIASAMQNLEAYSYRLVNVQLCVNLNLHVRPSASPIINIANYLHAHKHSFKSCETLVLGGQAQAVEMVITIEYGLSVRDWMLSYSIALTGSAWEWCISLSLSFQFHADLPLDCSSRRNEVACQNPWTTLVYISKTCSI